MSFRNGCYIHFSVPRGKEVSQDRIPNPGHTMPQRVLNRVGVEKGFVDLAGGLHCRTVGSVRVSRLSGDCRRPYCWCAQESDQPFDVLGDGGQEELLLNELQPAQAETL
jgi:hypothetical protein